MTPCPKIKLSSVNFELEKFCETLTLKSIDLKNNINEFKIIFKCMSGFTSENGKFIMPIKEKLNYNDSFDRCESEGFSICCDLFWNLF